MHDDDDDGDGVGQHAWVDEVQTWTRLYYVYTAVQAIFGDFRRIALVKEKQVGATLGPATLPTLSH